MFRKISRFFKANPWCLIPGFFVLYLLYKKVRTIGKGVANGIKNTAMTAAIDQALAEYDISPVRSSFVITVVNNIYDAFYKDWFGLFENEQKAADELNALQSPDEAICAAI